MSGSGNNTGASAGVGEAPPPCESLKFEAQLTSPQPAVVATLKIGDALDVVVAAIKGQIIVHVLKNGQAAGGLAGPDVLRLRNCVERGHTYHAVVKTINSGQVRVDIVHTS